MSTTRVSVRGFSSVCLFAFTLFLASCGGGGGGDGGGGGVTTFRAIDHNGVGLPGVNVYLDGGAVPMLDQTSLVTITNAIDTSNQPGFGQSFTAGITGTLAQVWIVGFGTGPSQPVTMRFCNGAGPCAAPTFVVLPLDQGSYTPDPGSGFRWKELDVSLQNFQVTAGQQYSFQFTNNTNANYQNCGGGYAGGQVFNSQCNGTGDLAFQTFVSPPPLGTTDATGSMPFNLTGVHSVHFHKAGYYATSHVNRDWTAVTGTVTIGAGPYPDVATTGTVSGTISNTAAGDGNIRVISRRSSDGLASFSFPLATGSSTAFSLTALIGTSDLFVVPNSTNFPAASSFIGYSPGVAVPSTVNPSLVRGAATSFAVTGIGGFPPPGSIAASYGVPTNRLFALASLFALTSASTSGATLAATTVNVPPLNQVYPNASYYLRVSAFSGPTGAGNYQVRYETRGFPTYADMVAAAPTQNIVLTDDTMSVIGPLHNTTSVSQSPTFTWSRVGSPDFVEVQLFEYDPVRLFYAKLIWYARVFGNVFSVTPPATVTLNPNSFYQYLLYARRDLFDGAGVLVGFQRNGWENIKFSTGATTPP